MKNSAIIILSILCINCASLLGQDQEVYLEAKDIHGVWVREVEENIGNGFYRKDTLTYYIGIDSVDCRLYHCYKGAEVLSYKKSYGRNRGIDQGYLYRENTVSSYDYDEEVASIEYTLIMTAAAIMGEFPITFMIPQGYDADTLVVRTNSGTFGLKKSGGF